MGPCSALEGACSGLVCSALVGACLVCSALVGACLVCSALVGACLVCSALVGACLVCSALVGACLRTAFNQARVTPLLKKPTLNTSLIGNYRPVSLLPFIAKTLERVVFNQVSLFLSQNNKLDAKQSGFRSGHSTETALLCH